MARLPNVTVPLTLQAKLERDPRYSNFLAHFSFQDTTAMVKEDGKEVGSVSGTIGGGIVVSLPSGRNWYIGPEEFWAAATKADQEFGERGG